MSLNIYSGGFFLLLGSLIIGVYSSPNLIRPGRIVNGEEVREGINTRVHSFQVS